MDTSEEHRAVTHRDNFGPSYRGVPIHTLPGIHEHSLILKYVPPVAEIVELGAGSGAMTLRLIDSGFKVTPVELDAENWKLSLKPLLADFNKVGWEGELFHGKRFKAAVAIETIEHLENPSKFFRDLAALIDPEGALIITTPNILFYDSLMLAVARGHFCMYSPEECFTTGHITVLPWWLTKHLAENNGFTLESISGACPLPILDTSPDAVPKKKSLLMTARAHFWTLRSKILRRIVERQYGCAKDPNRKIVKDCTNIIFVFRKR